MFVTTSLEPGQSTIEHKNGERIIRVSSYTLGKTSAQEIFNKAQEKIDKLNISDDYKVNMGGEREDIDESFNDMFRAMILGVLMIAALLVLQFKSYRQPFFILMTIPLALIGVFPGLVCGG